jgi:hypothetical protein
MTPHEVKFALDRKLLELARGGLVPVITGLHSVTLEDGTVFCGFDIVPDPTGSGILFFEFELPALVSRDDLRAFGEWLATSGYDGAVH